MAPVPKTWEKLKNKYTTMDEQRFAAIEAKIESIHATVEKTRKYFLATLVISVVLFVLPLIGLLFAIPYFLNSLASYQDLLL